MSAEKSKFRFSPLDVSGGAAISDRIECVSEPFTQDDVSRRNVSKHKVKALTDDKREISSSLTVLRHIYKRCYQGYLQMRVYLCKVAQLGETTTS